MEFCSSFYKERVFFGGYPTHLQLYELKKKGFDTIIDLTTIKERIKFSFDYSREKELPFLYYNFPIIDNYIPENRNIFVKFLTMIKEMIINNPSSKIYIHCKGGHGRSGIMVACLLTLLVSPCPYDSIGMTTYFHNLRPNLKEKWKKQLCPQNFNQRQFVINLFLYTSGHLKNNIKKQFPVKY